MSDVPQLSERVALLVVDMQNAFFEDPGLAAHRGSLLRHCNVLTALARSRGMPILNIRTEHRRDKSTWTLNMLDDDQGFLFEGSEQARNLADLDVSGAVEVVKRRDSAFWDTGLVGLLTDLGVEEVVIAGVATHTCIASTAADAYAADLRAWLVSDAIASADPDFASATLGLLQSEYRQKVVKTRALASGGPAQPPVEKAAPSGAGKAGEHIH